MAVKKKAKVEASCPLWLATYGDMITNLLVFFVLLLSMSEIQKEEQFRSFSQAIREAFGYTGGHLELPTEEEIETKNVVLAEMLVIPIRPQSFSNSNDRGVQGRESETTNIRHGQFVVGGKLYFKPLSAELSQDNLEKVADFAEKLRGYTTQIEVRGHCSKTPLDGSGFADFWDLTYARARAVADALVAGGIDSQRILLVPAGINQPVAKAAYTPADHMRNDLVELVQIDVQIGDMSEEP